MISKNNFQTTFAALKVIAPAKINLHLEVLGLREDGFHELAMLMQSIDLFDEISSPFSSNGQLTLSAITFNLLTLNKNLTLNEDKLTEPHNFFNNRKIFLYLHK